MNLSALNFQDKALSFARMLAIFAAFSVIFPVGMGNVTMALLLFAYLLSGKLSETWQMVKCTPATKTALILFAVFAIAVSYSSADLKTALLVLNKYRSLLLFPILLFLFQEEEVRKRAYFGYLIALAIAIIASWGMKIGWLQSGRIGEEWIPFKGRISYGFFLAFGIYLMAQQLLNCSNRRIQFGWSIAIIIAAHSLLFMQSGRTGLMVLAGLLLLLGFQFRQRLIRNWMPVLTIGVLVLIVVLSNSAALIQNKKDMLLAQAEPEVSSMGQRVIFWENSLRIIADHPIAGAGTGSFASEYVKHMDENTSIISENPHNEYLFVTSQLGLIGLGLFLWMFWKIWQASSSLPVREQALAQGVVVAILISCLFNSYLRDEGYFFATFAALALAGRKPSVT